MYYFVIVVVVLLNVDNGYSNLVIYRQQAMDRVILFLYRQDARRMFDAKYFEFLRHKFLVQSAKEIAMHAIAPVKVFRESSLF